VVLVDSSIWVRLEHERLSLRELIPTDVQVAVCPIVILEVLRGTRTARHAATRTMLAAATMLDAPTPLVRFEKAAELYRQCRDRGVTPSVADCLVAACAIAHGIPLLHGDRDFDHIARATTLRIFSRS